MAEVTEIFNRLIILLLHFHGQSGPTKENPDPLSYKEFEKINESANKVIYSYLR